MTDISGRLFISTIAQDAAGLAREHGIGLEIAEFCTAFNMDTDFETWDERVRLQMAGVERFLFHAPFNELCPAAVDPLIVDVAKKRYAQGYALMRGYGINAMVVHAGFIPTFYDEGWFAAKSINFWKEFLSDKPDDFRLYLENTFERTPDLLCEIVGAVNDKRFRLCLDVGHAAISGRGASIMEWEKRTAPFLRHVHLHNNDGMRDLHSAAGRGQIDMAAFVSAVLDDAREASFTIETSEARESVDWLRASGLL